MIIPKLEPSSLEKAVSALLSGRLVVLPTDTIYGFSALDTKEGEKAIRKAKGRGAEKGFIRLVAAPGDIKRYSSAKISPNLLSLWPGPLTLVLPLDEGETAAFRCPGDTWLREVVAKAGRAIFSTSVNISGDAPLFRARDIEAMFGGIASLIIEDERLERGGEALPSTIVDVSSRPYRVLRQGAAVIPKDALSF